MRLDKLENLITLEDIANGYIDDDSEDGICRDCKEHASPSYVIDLIDGKPGLSGEYVSNCCGGAIWIP